MMNLNRPHSFEDQTLVIVRVMTKNQTVRNLERISPLRNFLRDELLRRRGDLTLTRLRLRGEQIVDVRRDPANGHVVHVARNHVTQQLTWITLIMYAAVFRS